MENASGRIRVVQAPGGEPPEAIRKAWVGLELPCEPIAPMTRTLGVLSLEPSTHGRWVIAVPIYEALEILARERPFAAEWWEDNCQLPDDLTHFAFDFEDVMVLGGVVRQEVVEVTDEMQGDPNR